MHKTMSWAEGEVARPWSATLLYVAAAVLQAASRGLATVAARVSAAQAARRVAVQTVEFHALYGEAGAPEGALYVNGELVGVIEGVKRL
jgi:hypothetical protein